MEYVVNITVRIETRGNGYRVTLVTDDQICGMKDTPSIHAVYAYLDGRVGSLAAEDIVRAFEHKHKPVK